MKNTEPSNNIKTMQRMLSHLTSENLDSNPSEKAECLELVKNYFEKIIPSTNTIIRQSHK
jgi:hypothetical protein